ncbi:Tripartite-type tricarboxylate transporter, receptor component TctC [Polynucleobacter kasalickyi]|uniref:Tripartite-type tricarboxylate transporter, receptor component TctC n=2 Tax=Polynucleobacter kasalickyi TaxID=1938817 RepID=A0A1W1Y9W9_9BURK|nr:Tripartite-type tricarboxylate transporter, receptor component TctC [Polynucleobacter kasalickyi]
MHAFVERFSFSNGMKFGSYFWLVLSFCLSISVNAQTGVNNLNVPNSGVIKIIVPYPPGGGTDIIARAISQKVGELLQQPVVVENRNGANGSIGSAFVAKAAGDGFTLLVVPAGFSANPSIYPNLPFDQKKDLTGVTMLASGPLVLVVNPNVKVKNTRELISLVKSKPDQFNYASAGMGSLPHLTAELFNLEAGTKMVHIPYKGAGPAVIDLMGGIVPVYFMNILQAKPLIAEGSIRALAVTSPQRSSIDPELPSIAEELPGFDMMNWYGVLAPASTSKELLDKVNQAVVVALNTPKVKEKLNQEGMTVVGNKPNDFNTFLKKEMDKYSRIVKQAGL